MNRQKDRTLELMSMCRAMKQCACLITLVIMREEFKATDTQLKNFYKIFKQECEKYQVWTPHGLQKAKQDFRNIAKTYNCEIMPDPSRMIKGNQTENKIILYSEATCMYISMRLLRKVFGANYKQLDYFTDSYIGFCQIYEEGQQASMREISDDLVDNIGINILG